MNLDAQIIVSVSEASNDFAHVMYMATIMVVL